MKVMSIDETYTSNMRHNILNKMNEFFSVSRVGDKSLMITSCRKIVTVIQAYLLWHISTFHLLRVC